MQKSEISEGTDPLNLSYCIRKRTPKLHYGFPPCEENYSDFGVTHIYVCESRLCCLLVEYLRASYLTL